MTSGAYSATDLSPGVFTTCYLPDWGVWTQLTGSSSLLTVMELPSLLTPTSGLAGMGTQLELSGAVDDDFVVLRSGGWVGAASEATGSVSLAPTVVSGGAHVSPPLP